MENKIRNLLDEEIETRLLNVSALATGSEEESTAISELERLHKLRVEELKIEADYRSKQDQINADKEARIIENGLKHEQLRSQAIDRWVNMGTQIGIAIGGWALYRHCFREGLKFEQFGTLSTPWMRNLVSKILPRK